MRLVEFVKEKVPLNGQSLQLMWTKVEWLLFTVEENQQAKLRDN
jgi:hypothetical protein